ncbi:MAG: M20/M25/M40 family metallo-hydrolase [Candidatus Bathyarchaeia archaeon]
MNAYEVKFLIDMLKLYSPSGGESAVAKYLRETLSRSNFDVRIDDTGNVIGTCGSGSPTLLLCGHMDTVPGQLEVRLDGDLLYGRGAVDAKGPLASMIMGSNIPDLNGKIVVACLVDEEGNGKGVKQLIKDNVQADYAIFGEPSGACNITIGYKGSLHVYVECITPTAHSSAPWLSSNAIEKTYEFWDNIKGYNFDCDIAESRFYSVTSCLTALKGGGTPGLIPSRCEAEIDIRTPPQTAPEKIIKTIIELAQDYERRNPDVKIKIRDAGYIPAFEADPRSILVRALRYSIRKVCGRTPILLKKTGTGDMNELGSKLNIPMVAYGPGDSHLDHTPNEHISISEYLTSIRVYREAIPMIFKLHRNVGD